jgi:acyl-CoA synthetase (AMP-forming)/AMP-acid ligase II
MNIAEVLSAHARAHPGDAAIIDGRRRRPRRTTFAELDRAGACGAALLWRHGLRPGDAVLVFQPMSMELYAALQAVFRLGLTAMFLDPSAGLDHIERCCALHPPRALLAADRVHLLRLRSPALRRIPLKFVIGWPVPGAVPWSRAAALPPHPEVAPCDPETPALLTFTSGSTGQPKAAVRSHGLLMAQHRALAHSLRLTRGDVDLTTMPIVLLANLASGVASLIPAVDLRAPGAIDPAPVLAQIQEHRPVSSVASPAFFERLVRHCAPRGLRLPSFRKLFTGGAPVFPRLLDQMQAMAPDAEVTAVYGSTEAEPIAHVARGEVSAGDLQAMLGGQGLLAGPPVPEIRVAILRDQWGRPVGPYTAAEFATQCEPDGRPGEIVVSGDHVLTGYLHGRGDEETKFKVDGAVWHRTGDAGCRDGQGRLWLLGRCSARIEDGRGALYPFAVETAVYQDAAIRRAALVGRAGRRVLALEYYDGQAKPDLASLRSSVAWAGLDEVRVCAHLPVDKRHNAKIDYPALHKLLDQYKMRL